MDLTAHTAEIVRTHDRDRYLADLFAPEHRRRHLFALHAFNVEIARVREVAKEPGLGEIRLQFWRDAIHGEGGGHPVGQALARTIAECALPVDAFDRMIEARRFDLYDDPMPSLNDLEGYAGDTSSSLIQIATLVLADGRDPGAAEIAGHAGVAYALTGLMRAFPVHASRGQSFLPADLLEAHRVDLRSVFAGLSSPELLAALAELRSIARGHLATVRAAAGDIEPGLFPAFLPVALVEPQLDRMERDDFNPLKPTAELTQLRRQWILWRAARRRSI
jgi:phytoene synthase